MISFLVAANLVMAAVPALEVADSVSHPAVPAFGVSVLGSDDVWKDVPVHSIKVDRVLDCRHHPEDASMAIFTQNGKSAVIQVISSVHVNSVKVRPASSGVVPQVNGDTISLEILRPGTLSVEVNGDIYHNLHLIANQPYDEPSGHFSKTKGAGWLTSSDGGTLIFPPGFHKLPDGYLDVRSGQKIYLSDGAWVEGGIRVRDVSDVHIFGPGVLRPVGRGYGVEISRSRGVVVEGITTTQVPCGGSTDVVIRNVKCFTHYGWGDGLNIFASSNVVHQGCFVRTSDDCITVYATRKGYVGSSKNISVSDMTLWADVAHPIFIGLHGAAASDDEDVRQRCDTISRLRFSNIDILEHNERQVDYQGCMAIVAGDDNVVDDVLFEDIRVDSIRQGSLLTLRIFKNEKYCRSPGKSISNVTFRDVSFVGGGELSVIEGYSPERTVSGVVFENLLIGGVHVCDTMPGKPKWYKTSDMCRFLVGPYVQDLVFR